jgi:hypothetical protein
MNAARHKHRHALASSRKRLSEFRKFCWLRSLMIFGVLAILAIGAFANAATSRSVKDLSWKDLNGKSFVVVQGGDECAAGGFTMMEKSGRRSITLGPAIHFDYDLQKGVTVISETVPGSCHYETEVTGSATKISSTTNATSCPDLPNDTVIESLAINKSGQLDYSIRRKENGKPDLVTTCVFKIGKLKD